MISDDLRRGRLVPFLGAGASLTARPAQATWNAQGSPFPPSAKELSDFLAEYASFPTEESRDDLAKVASFVQLIGGRRRLHDCLVDVFNQDFETGQVHELLADLDDPVLIVTTNYDDLIEQAFKKRGKPYHVVQWTDDPGFAGSVLWWNIDEDEPKPFPPKSLPLDPGEQTIIYKIHGTIDKRAQRWNSFLITEEDYIDFLSSMTRQAAIPATFKRHFKQSSFLFLGYGLGDWNLRVLLRNMKSQWSFGGADQSLRAPAVVTGEDDLRSWAIQRRPSVLESELWKTRAVDIYDVDLNDFISKLRPHVK